ncbi:MAG: glycosyltransferase [Gemmatimonadaceae bacterium]|nr:glycosyltransferase [Gemmatimonadaceae bacterium]
MSSLQLAGLERVIAELIEGQRLAGLEASALVVHEAGVLGERLVAAGYPVRVLGAPLARPWQRVPRLVEALRTEVQADVIHLHGGNWWSYARSIRAGTRAAHLYTLHGEHFPPRWQDRVTEFMGALSTDHLVLVSEDLRHTARRNLLDRWCPVEVIQNGIRKLDLDFEQRPRSPGPFTLVHVARTELVKRQDLSLEVVRRLRADGIDARVRFAGRGDARPYYERLAADLGVAEHVEWLGIVPDTEIAGVMQQADALILPSDHEGTSIALLEAIALERPCLVSDVGDSGRVMAAAREWVAPKGDAAALARIARAIHDDPAGAAATAARVKVDVRRRYGRAAMVDAYTRAYRTVLARR